MVASNKDRVYIALYARGGLDPNSYHWAIIVGPKNEVEGERGTRYHVRNRYVPEQPGPPVWQYEALAIPLVQTNMLLARVMIGKVLDGSRLRTVLERVPLVQQDPAWTCRIWVKSAVAALEADGKCLGTRVSEWQMIERTANDYVAKKRQEKRFETSGKWPPLTVPTYDLLEGKEVIP